MILVLALSGLGFTVVTSARQVFRWVRVERMILYSAQIRTCEVPCAKSLMDSRMKVRPGKNG